MYLKSLAFLKVGFSLTGLLHMYHILFILRYILALSFSNELKNVMSLEWHKMWIRICKHQEKWQKDFSLTSLEMISLGIFCLLKHHSTLVQIDLSSEASKIWQKSANEESWGYIYLSFQMMTFKWHSYSYSSVYDNVKRKIVMIKNICHGPYIDKY